MADRAEAEALIGALAGDEHDERALGACAFYGLRRGELRAVRWSDVDFAAGMIHVVRGWDDADGPITTKSLAGERRGPLAGQLRKLLIAHKLTSKRHGADLVFGRTATLPFISSTVRARALADRWVTGGPDLERSGAVSTGGRALDSFMDGGPTEANRHRYRSRFGPNQSGPAPWAPTPPGPTALRAVATSE